MSLKPLFPSYLDLGVRPALYDDESMTVIESEAEVRKRVTDIIAETNKILEYNKNEQNRVNQAILDLLQKISEIYTTIKANNVDIINDIIQSMVKDDTFKNMINEELLNKLNNAIIKFTPKIDKPIGCNYFMPFIDNDIDLVKIEEVCTKLKSIGMNTFILLPIATQPQFTSSSVTTYYNTDNNLKLAIDKIIQCGLKPILKCHIECDEGWRGKIKPADVIQWHTSVRDFLVHYATIAESYHMEYFCMLEEMQGVSANNRGEWIATINAIKQVYSGKITYGVNFTYETDEITTCCFMDLLDVIGVDNYVPLSTGLKTDLNTCKYIGANQVFNILENIHLKYNKPILFAEFGYCAWDGGTLFPNGENILDYSKDRTNHQEMINGYITMLDMFGYVDWFEGFWYWSEKQNLNERNVMSILRNEELQNVIKKYFIKE